MQRCRARQSSLQLPLRWHSPLLCCLSAPTHTSKVKGSLLLASRPTLTILVASLVLVPFTLSRSCPLIMTRVVPDVVTASCTGLAAVVGATRMLPVTCTAKLVLYLALTQVWPKGLAGLQAQSRPGT